MDHRIAASLLALGIVAACSASSDDTSDAAAAEATSTSAGGGSSGTASTSGAGGLDDIDAGNHEGGLSPSCQYVDLLFVIDNSPSMGPYQEALAGAFPGFVDAMIKNLPANVDLHVGITTTSFFTGSCSESVSNCVTQATPADIQAHYTKPQDGSTGTNGEQGRLFEHDGKAFFSANTSGDPAPLKQWFAAAAVEAGETGCSYEMSSAGAGYVAHPANATANAGFLRDEDAVLLVFVLSDEPDKSPETTDTYKQMLVTAKTKCGGEKCILTAGIIDPCIKDVNNSLWLFLNAFGQAPITGDIDDSAKYTDVVGGALAQVVKKTCDDIGTPK